MTNKTENQVIEELTLRSTENEAYTRLGAYSVVPEGATVKSLEEYQERPNYIEFDHNFKTIEGFVGFCDRYKTTETVFFGNVYDRGRPLIEARFDFHAIDEELIPAWNKFGIRLNPNFDYRYVAWNNIGEVDQKAAGEFLLDRLADIVEPDNSEMYSKIMEFTANKNVTYTSVRNLQNGERELLFSEKNDGDKSTVMPDKMRLLIPVFEGADVLDVMVRLQYRISEGKLLFKFTIQDHQSIESAASEVMIKQAAKELGEPILI